MLGLPNFRFRLPRFSFRFFIYFLFGLMILVLAVEGGYYFWAQREIKKQAQNPVIARQEGVFTYINSPDGSVEKMILGTIEKLDGNLLTIKTDNNKIVQVLFTGENLLITDLTSIRPGDRPEPGDFKTGTRDDLSIGDVVRVGEIHSENKGQITSKFLAVVKGK